MSELRFWHDGAAKQSILDFVGRVTRAGGPDYVPPAERIAVFDNDLLEAPAETILSGTRCLMTLLAGRIVHDAR